MQSGLRAWKHSTKNSPEIQQAHKIFQTSQHMFTITQLLKTVEIDLLSLRVQEIFDTEAGSTPYSVANRPENIPLFAFKRYSTLKPARPPILWQIGQKTFHRKFTRNSASSSNLSKLHSLCALQSATKCNWDLSPISSRSRDIRHWSHLVRLMGTKSFDQKFTRNMASSPNWSNFTAYVLHHSATRHSRSRSPVSSRSWDIRHWSPYDPSLQAYGHENIPPKIHQKFGELSKFIKLHGWCASKSAGKHSTKNSPEIR